MKLGEHTVTKWTAKEICKRGVRLRKKSVGFIPIDPSDLGEDLEFVVDGVWYRVFLHDYVNDEFYVERIEE